MAGWEVEARAFQPGDESRLLEGFKRSARAAGGGPRRELSELHWRYCTAPHGALLSFALEAREASRPIAGLCATRHRARFQGGEAFWLEVGDVFNDFAHGKGLVRARGLEAAGEAFAESFCGFAPEKHPVAYGLPDRRAHRFGLRRLGWEVLRSESELALELARGPRVAPAAGVVIEEPQRFPDDVERAFERYAAGRAAILVRDAAYLNWRYVERPGAPFELALARRSGEPLGYAALRDGCLFDWGAPLDDEEVARALLAWARERAASDGARELTAVVPASAPEFLLFQRLGFRVRGTREYLCFKSFQRPAIMSWLFENWTYSRGDTLR